jgi:hypothetical protein
MFDTIDLGMLAAACGGTGNNTEDTNTTGSQVSIKRSNMGACLDDVARRCESDPNNRWMLGMFGDQNKIGQCKAQTAPIQCFDPPSQ